MAQSMVEVECPCGFKVRGHDEKEVVQILKTHAKQSHSHDLTEQQIKESIKQV